MIFIFLLYTEESTDCEKALFFSCQSFSTRNPCTRGASGDKRGRSSSSLFCNVLVYKRAD